MSQCLKTTLLLLLGICSSCLGWEVVSTLDGGSRTVRSVPPVTILFTIEKVQSIEVLDPGSTDEGENQDQIISQTSSTSYVQRYTLTPQVAPGSGEIASVEIESSNEAVGIPNGADVEYGGTPGTVVATMTLTNTVGAVVYNTVSLSFQPTGGTVTTEIIGGVPGSARENLTEAVDDRIAGLNTTALPIYSVQNHGTATYTRNTACWTNVGTDIDLTCISPWNSYGANTRAGTLVTPRHIIFASHYPIAPGSTIRFVTNSNTVVTRTVTHTKLLATYGYHPDIGVGLLDSDVPGTITHCKILPQDYTTYFPTSILRMPALGLDQEEKALVKDGHQTSTGIYAMFSFVAPAIAQRLLLYETTIVGDSGNPCFFIINGELVLTTVWLFGGGGGGTSIVYYADTINDAILDVDLAALVSTGYTLTPIDLSSFTAY